MLVGVDGSDHSVTALDFAFDVAHRTGASVVATHAWWAGRTAPDADVRHGAETAGAVLGDALEPWRAKFPDVRLEEKLVCGADVAEHLVAESAHAGLLLGSVSLSVAQHAQCPVAIVR